MRVRTAICLFALSTWCLALPDATPLQPKGRSMQITIGFGGIDIDAVWRDDDLVAILNRPGRDDRYDQQAVDAVLHQDEQDGGAEALDLDDRLTDQAGDLAAPPRINDDDTIQ